MDKTTKIAGSIKELYEDVNSALRYVSILGAMQNEDFPIDERIIENFYLNIEVIRRSYESLKTVFYAED